MELLSKFWDRLLDITKLIIGERVEKIGRGAGKFFKNNNPKERLLRTREYKISKVHEKSK